MTVLPDWAKATAVPIFIRAGGRYYTSSSFGLRTLAEPVAPNPQIKL
jgi:hypothetical protein